MNTGKARSIALWIAGIIVALWCVTQARYVADLSAFLPSKPTPTQQLLVEQLRNGPGSRLVLIALENGAAETRARLGASMATRLREDRAFSSVNDGEPLSADRDRAFVFEHRYVLSDAVTDQRFSPGGLRAAISETLDSLSASTGLLLKSLVPQDPTGETLRIIDQLTPANGPQTRDGVWSSADGMRTLLAAQTAAVGSDTDAQENALVAIHAAFHATAAAAGPAASSIELRISGPGVFAVAARAKIKQAATRLSIAGGVLVISVLLVVYRSVTALCLGLLPVATGALIGIAAVALGFGVVHGITLGFGTTLIGESVDYSVYFFVRSPVQSWQHVLWPTIRLGMLTSVCGFVSLLPSGFPGLAQLGLYSISGLIAAALVTRFVLPQLVPPGFAIRDVAPLGARFARVRAAIRERGTPAVFSLGAAIALVALLVLVSHREHLWNRELSALSPVPAADLRYDARLRADLGTADPSVIVVSGLDLESVLRGAERAGHTLQTLVDTAVIGGFDTPSNYLPSLAMQQARRRALPDEATLRSNLRSALAGLNVDEDRLEPFIRDIDAARRAAPLEPNDLRGSTMATGFDALTVHTPGHWSALLPLHPAGNAGTADLDLVRVAAALAAARLPDTQVLDLKTQTDALYSQYLHEAIRLSLIGFALIALLLASALRSMVRVCRVLAPLVLAVLTVAAALTLAGRQLTILHLVGMLLIIAVGSNYALFFDAEAERQENSSLMLASLGIANLSTVIAFGLLSFSQVPVLQALGVTVAPGTFLALLFSAAMTSSSAERVHA
jgi:predicted exporter